MRTTIRLDDVLLRRAKAAAAARGIALDDLIADAVRAALAQRPTCSRTAPAGARVALPTFKGCGLQPGVRLDECGALTDLMDDRST
jgi:hypothetical protein